MKNLFQAFLSIFIVLQSLSAQLPNTKINTDLFRLWQESLSNEDELNKQIPILLKGQPDSLRQLVLRHKGHFKYAVGDIASVSLPVRAISDLLEHSSVQRLEHRIVKTANLFHEDSTADVNNNIRPVHQGQGILPQGFRGEGIVLGIIDDGFEWQHPDFLTQDSSSRIQFLWDQNHVNPDYFENFYAYGSSWDVTAIDSGYITHSPGGHGSHVLGTAAGNARAAGKYVGIAPEADIVAVSINENGNDFLGSFVDGVHYIFNKATALGKPCAINSSVGTYSGAHDGRDLYSALIDSMLQTPGRALIQAGGNARQFNMHWQANLQAGLVDTARVWMQPVASAFSTFSYIFADTADFNGLSFSFEWIDRTTHQIKGYTQAFQVLRDFSFSGNQPALLRDTLFLVNGSPVVLFIYIEQWAGVYEILVQIKNSQNTNDYWQLTLSGEGKMDLWSNSNTLGSSNLVMNGSAAHYLNPDNNQSIVGFWTCSENVITVASYQNMAWLENYSGDTVSLSTTGWLPPGISHFSSLGPTRDGRQKPDLAAPGGQVMSAATLSTLLSYRSNGYAYLDEAGWHVSNRGTSMAAPMVAGAAALYFQCRPQSTALELKAALQAAARLDSFVFAQSTELPNIHWGYGKLDVYNLISGCLLYGCTDSTAPNYNPAAHIEDGSCILPLSLNVINNDFSLSAAPNPFSNLLSINVSLPDGQEAELCVADALGRIVWQMPVAAGTKQLSWDRGNLPAGCYWLMLRANGKVQRLLTVVAGG